MTMEDVVCSLAENRCHDARLNRSPVKSSCVLQISCDVTMCTHVDVMYCVHISCDVVIRCATVTSELLSSHIQTRLELLLSLQYIST